MSLQVEVDLPGGARSTHALAGAGSTWIGREDTCDVVLDSPLVSRRHACIECDGDQLWVRDSSSNGTEVAGALLRGERRALDRDAELGIGPFRLRLRPASSVVGGTTPATRRTIHRALLDRLDLTNLASCDRSDPGLWRDVLEALHVLCSEQRFGVPQEARATLAHELCDEALGLGPLQGLLADEQVTEIMVVDPSTIFAERAGRIERTAAAFTDADSVRAVIERIVTPLGRRIDESSPIVDARLPDGSRVNAIVPPLATKGPCITIRKFPKHKLDLDALVARGSLDAAVAQFLARAVVARRNIVVAGGTGSGKTTLLGALSGCIPPHERIVTIEDAAELLLQQPHVVALESRPANAEGNGEVAIRDLVRNALRMRPDRIVVGECRGGEAVDMLQAMNTGHEGSMTTTHANSPKEALSRIETLSLMAGLDLPLRAIRMQIGASIHLIVQQARSSDGVRRVTCVAEVAGVGDDGEIELHDVFRWDGRLRATGYLPRCVDRFLELGLLEDGAFP